MKRAVWYQPVIACVFLSGASGPVFSLYVFLNVTSESFVNKNVVEMNKIFLCSIVEHVHSGGLYTVLKNQKLHPIPSQSNVVNTLKPSFSNPLDITLRSAHKYATCYLPYRIIN